MKKPLLLPLFLLLAFAATAQNYIPMLQDSNRWNVANIQHNYVRTNIEFIGKDTLINGNNFKTLAGSATGKAVLNEDVDSGKVWVRNFNGSQRIMYDFSLQQGDSIFLEFFSFEGPERSPGKAWFLVDSTFTINTLAGERKALWLSHNEWTLTEPMYNKPGMLWIEGVGATAGPAYLHYMYNATHGPQAFETICQFRGADHHFALYKADSCEVRVGDTNPGIEERNSFQFTIYPNPATENIFVKMEEFMPNSVSNVYDLHGRLLIQQNLNFDNRINIAHLPKGHYLIEIRNSKGTARQLLVKQ